MIVTTFQNASILNEIETQGTACCHVKTLADEGDAFRQAYDWMAEQMNKRIGYPEHEGVKYPLWGWVQEGCSRKPIRPSSGYFSETVGKVAMITADIPDEFLLLSDFTEWHSVLNEAMAGNNRKLLRDIKRYEGGKYIPFSEYPEELRNRIIASWDIAFDLDSKGKGCPKRRNRSIQCCFWELRKEWLRDVRILDAKGYK